MSETTLILLVTTAIIVAMFAWVPLLQFFCPPCGRYVSRLRRKPVSPVRDSPAPRNVEAA